MKYLIKNTAWKINKDYDKEKLLYLLIDRPDKITFYDDFVWKSCIGLNHRNYDLPAFIYDRGIVVWYKHGKRKTIKERNIFIYKNS